MEPTVRHFSTNSSAFGAGQNDTQVLPDYIRMISNIFFPTILVIGVIGNVMVIMVICRMEHMRSSTNIFLANLAISDLMVLLVWGTEQLIDNNLKLGIMAYSDNMCNLVFIFMETVYDVSVLTILIIGFERYNAICKPMKFRYICTKSRAYRISLLTWPFAILFSSPHLFITYRTHQYTEGIYTKTICEKPDDSFLTNAFYITSALLFYVLPLIILTVFFLVIAQRLKRPMDTNAITVITKHRRRVVTMLATVIVAFFVGHLPIRVAYLLYFFASREIIGRFGVVGFKAMRLSAVSMLYFDSIVNPFLYNLMSKKFRAGFKSLCRGIGCRKNAQSGEGVQTTTTESIPCDLKRAVWRESVELL